METGTSPTDSEKGQWLMKKSTSLRSRKKIIYALLLLLSFFISVVSLLNDKTYATQTTTNADNSTGFLQKSGTNYTSVWEASSGTASSGSNFLVIGQRLFISTYYVYRGVFIFDTSAIPDNNVVEEAIISLSAQEERAGSFYITVQNGQPTYPHDPPISGDYNKDHYSGNGGSRQWVHPGPEPNTYWNITLNSDGRSWINKTGMTKLVLRSQDDIDGTAPTGVERVYFNGPTSSYPPKLYLTYSNPEPTNDQCSITDMDDGDNLYAQRTWYTIDYDVSDPSGYSDIDYAEVRFKQSSLTRAIFRYDEDTNSFSIPTGSDTWDLDTGSCSATESGTYINMTFKVKPQWDAIEENNLEIECYVVDSYGQSDTDVMQSNYFDVITDLTTSFSIDDDRGNPSQSITASGTVTYWGSSLYPPNAEFISVSVYDSNNNVKGTDSSIVNGAWSVSFSASSSVEEETYNLYINMLDSDYSDGEESPTDTFITDKLTVNINANATTLFTGETVGSIITATYAFDSSPVSDWSLNVLRNETHYATNNFTDSSETELVYQYTTENVTENTYGLTGFTSNTLTVTWTNLYIEIHQITVNNTRPDVNEAVLISYQLRYGNNESAVPSGTLWVNSQNYSISSGFANFTATKTSVQAVTYNATAVEVNGETDLVQIPEDPQVIWDTLTITFSASNLFPLPGHNVTISWVIKRSYDNSIVSNFTVTVTKNAEAWKEDYQLSNASDLSSIVFTGNYDASSVTDNTYNLTTFSSSPIQVIWTEEGGQSGSSGSSKEEEEEEPLITPPVTPPKIVIPNWGYYVIGGAILLIALGAVFNKATSKKRKMRGAQVKRQKYTPRNLSGNRAPLRNINKKRKNQRRRI